MLRDLIAGQIEPYVLDAYDRLFPLPPATYSEALNRLLNYPVLPG